MPLFTLKNINFKNIICYKKIEIKADCATFICGESGSGKSTLLKLLNGVITPTSGDIIYNRENINTLNPIALRQEVLLAGQAACLFDKSVKDNFCTYHSYRNLDIMCNEKIKHFLKICSVNLPLNSMCNILSGGERQRIFLAINLSLGAKVLMLDEPTSALDDKNAHIFMQNLKAYCKEKQMTLIVVSHDSAMAEQYADHIITLKGGGGNERE